MYLKTHVDGGLFSLDILSMNVIVRSTLSYVKLKILLGFRHNSSVCVQNSTHCSCLYCFSLPCNSALGLIKFSYGWKVVRAAGSYTDCGGWSKVVGIRHRL